MARQKITEAQDEGDDDLPQLTPQQMHFVECLLNGNTASDAYRKAYHTENCQPETIWAAASRLRNDSKVSVWLSAARKAELGTAIVNLEQYIRGQARLRELCIDKGNLGAAVTAQKAIGDACGHHIQRTVELERDPLQVLNEIRSQSPAVAEQLEQELRQRGVSVH
jgi:hypothetical protein